MGFFKCAAGGGVCGAFVHGVSPQFGVCLLALNMGHSLLSYKRDFSTPQLRYTYVYMPDRLPPLTALRAFEAAARHMSFAKAADELHVTPAALSFQIKSLEDHLGEPLFRRLNRAVDVETVSSPSASVARDNDSI